MRRLGRHNSNAEKKQNNKKKQPKNVEPIARIKDGGQRKTPIEPVIERNRNERKSAAGRGSFLEVGSVKLGKNPVKPSQTR